MTTPTSSIISPKKYITTVDFIKEFRRYCIHRERDEPQEPLKTYLVLCAPNGCDNNGIFDEIIKAPNVIKATILLYDRVVDSEEQVVWDCIRHNMLNVHMPAFMTTISRDATSFVSSDIPNLMNYMYDQIKSGKFNTYDDIYEYVKELNEEKCYSEYKDEADVMFIGSDYFDDEDDADDDDDADNSAVGSEYGNLV